MFRKKKKTTIEPKKEKRAEPTQTFAVSDRRSSAADEADLSDADGYAPRLPTYVETLKQSVEKSLHRMKEVEREADEIRKRLERDVDRRMQAREKDMFQDFVTILDNLERSLASAPPALKKDPFFNGIEMIYGQIQALLERRGVKKISLVGKKFDPQFAEAIDVVSTPDPEKDGDIVDEITPAYLYNESLLRAARVRVAKLAPAVDRKAP
jgi:molecular chaperone GrpE